MNFFAILTLGSQILGAIEGFSAQFQSGLTVAVPPIRTYLFGKHVQLSITIQPLDQPQSLAAALAPKPTV